MEERWEAVDEAEVVFRAASSRAAIENVGIAYFPTGTRLIRIGVAGDAELAAWRYGAILRRRKLVGRLERGGDWMASHVAPLVWQVAFVASLGALTVTSSAGLVAVGMVAVEVPRRWFWRRRGLHILLPSRSIDPSGESAAPPIRLVDALGARLCWEEGALALRLETAPLDEVRRSIRWTVGVDPMRDAVVVRGDAARQVLTRLLVFVNRLGATRSQIEAALALISLAGGADAFITEVAKRGFGVGGRRNRRRPKSAPRLIPPLEGLALELALHDSTERAVLAGELRHLRGAWEEAAAIAAIADGI